MSTLKQIGLLPAGCQPWNMDVCAASGDRFAYAATLAVYIYELDHHFNEFKLHSIMSEHSKTITAVAWNPRDNDLLASAAADKRIIVWNVSGRRSVANFDNTTRTPVAIGWSVHDADTLSFAYSRGPLCFWAFAVDGAASSAGQAGSSPPLPSRLSLHREAQHFTSDICCFRWHPCKAGRLVIAHRNGTVSLYCPGAKSYKQVTVTGDDAITDTPDDAVDPVTSIEWDPLSVQYLLLASGGAGVRMVDADNACVLTTYLPPSAATLLRSVAWLDGAPGMFATGDSQAGVLRLWTVSSSTPLESIRLKKTGFHALHVFSTVACPESPGAAGEGRATTNEGRGRTALPPVHAVCTFLDGGVGLYDLSKRRWNFIRNYGHIETIFDCKFKPDDPNLLATGSFDGTIKIWDVNTLTAVDSSPGNEGVIYCLSWAPADLNCIVASTSRNGAFIWDVTKGKVIVRFDEHGKDSVYAVSWNQKDSSKIATAGADGQCIIHQVDGKVLVRYKHPGPVFGCDWHPSNKDMIATSCEDKCVRVYYLTTNSEQSLKVFTGHTAKVFQVKWSPLREGILASGSDDCTVRVWDYTEAQCLAVLTGHMAYVRGLLWNPELPYILLSGSWDYAIRVWDTRSGTCLDTVVDHGADVYGLTCHPRRPCVLASCSRDSTVRLWSMLPLLQPLEMLVLADRPLVEIYGTADGSPQDDTGMFLKGRESRCLRNKLESADQLTRLKEFYQFLGSAAGTDNLWQLVSVIQGMSDGELSDNYSEGIMHNKHVTKFKAAEAQTLELVKMSRFGAGVGAPSRECRLQQAAEMHALLGGLRKYCELMVELDQWDKALSVAPGVSMEYWKSLAERRASVLINSADSDSDVTPLCVATGNSQRLISYFTSRGQRQEALTVACAVNEGGIGCTLQSPGISAAAAASNGITCVDADTSMNLLVSTSSELAEWYFCNGMAVQAACCHLAADDVNNAVLKLIRGNELELAVAVGRNLGADEMTAVATHLLARRCERLGLWNLAIEMIQNTQHTDMILAKVCARSDISNAARDALYRQAGFPSMKECLQFATELSHRQDATGQCVKYFLLSTSPEMGLAVGLAYVKKKISTHDWTAEDVSDLLDLMASIHTDKLKQDSCTKLCSELMVLCAYIGALLAVRRNYTTIIQPLFKHVEFLLQRDSPDVPLSMSRVVTELDAWLAHQGDDSEHSSSHQVTLEQRDHYADLLRKAGTETLYFGPDVVTGSLLPGHADDNRCHMTGQVIQGPVFHLEDKRSVISLNSALMWAKVNPFSPLATAALINPF